MLEAAAAEAGRLGMTPLIIGDAIEGEAQGAGRYRDQLRSTRFSGQKAVRAAVLWRNDGDAERHWCLRRAGYAGPRSRARCRPAPASGGQDAWGFFAVLDDLPVTGPTRTDVDDFRALLVGLE